MRFRPWSTRHTSLGFMNSNCKATISVMRVPSRWVRLVCSGGCVSSTSARLKTFWLRDGNDVPELFARAMMSRGIGVV